MTAQHTTIGVPTWTAANQRHGVTNGEIVSASLALQTSLESTALLGSKPTAARLTYSRPQATLVIPVYNEEEALPHVLKDIFAALDDTYEVIVVDDGSKDRTRAIAATFPCRVIVHTVNQGKGAAMMTGIRYAQSDKVIFIDGDATYPAIAIPAVAAQLDAYDLVRCVRSLGRDNIPFINRVGNQIFDGLISLVHRVEGGDVLSGLYGLRRQHLLAMRLNSQGFDIETEIMVKASAMELTSHGIPIQYNERIGEKKLNPLKDGFKILLRILSLALIFNPFATYIMPGLALWGIGILSLLLLTLGGPIYTPIANFSIHTLIVSVMSFLAGFQLVVFGCVVNLYAAESGMSKPNRALSHLAARAPRLGGAAVGAGLIVTGAAWSLALAISWVYSGMGLFFLTEPLIIALALIVWGIQLLSTMIFLSLFANSRKYMAALEVQQANAVEHIPSEEALLEQAVGDTTFG